MTGTAATLLTGSLTALPTTAAVEDEQYRPCRRLLSNLSCAALAAREVNEVATTAMLAPMLVLVMSRHQG